MTKSHLIDFPGITTGSLIDFVRGETPGAGLLQPFEDPAGLPGLPGPTPAGLPRVRGSGILPGQIPPYWPSQPAPAKRLSPIFESVSLPPAIAKLLATPIAEFQKQRALPATGEQVTHAALLLDESGSMDKHKAAVLEGFNAQVKVVKKGAKSAGSTFVSLDLFAGTSRPVLSNTSARSLKPLKPEQYCPNGGTGLFDAIGLAVARLLDLPYADDPNASFLVAAFTDGEENSSRVFTGTVLKEVLARLEATGRWTFTLMGPTGGAEEIAGVLNLHAGNVASFNPAQAASVQQAFTNMAQASETYLHSRSVGLRGSTTLYSAGKED